jgi:hypothetical protein
VRTTLRPTGSALRVWGAMGAAAYRETSGKVGSQRFSLQPGQYKRIEVKVRAAARRRLARKRRLTVRASARYITVAGEPERTKRTYRVDARWLRAERRPERASRLHEHETDRR